jgi:ankyrin repeat protein
MLNTDWINQLQNIPYKKTYSQWGQDGLIEFIFKNIGTTNKFCIEFGFNTTDLTGGSGANVAKLVVEDGWTPLLFDSNHENPNINLHKELLTFENIGNIFKTYSAPQCPDYVSIDVDSIDLWLLKGMLLADFRPRLISVEYNCNFPIDVNATVPLDNTWSNDAVYGASLLALNCLAEEFDYRLICVERGCDLFFIRNDLAPGKTNLSEFSKFTGFPAHPTPTKERAKQLIEYPTLTPLDPSKYPFPTTE